MVEIHLEQTPLAHHHLHSNSEIESDNSKEAIMISECPTHTQLAIRGELSEKKFALIVKKVIGIALPQNPCTASTNSKGDRILWMGPDEWLIILQGADKLHLKYELGNSLKNTFSAVIDVSNSRSILRITGAKSRETLMKGCSIDLHPRSFKVNSVVNTWLAQARIALHKISESNYSESYDIYVHRSFADYLWMWLQDAVKEYSTKI
jgi:sarcosine oxidase subunit gamma